MAVVCGIELGLVGTAPGLVVVRPGVRPVALRQAEGSIALMQEVCEMRCQNKVVLCEIEEEGSADEQRHLARIGGHRVDVRAEDLTHCLRKRRCDKDLPLVEVGEANGVCRSVSAQNIRLENIYKELGNFC